MQSQKNDPSKIHYQVTRPVVPVIDTDGKGDYNISPIGFPLRDSNYTNPTIFQPNFNIGYTEFVSSGTRYVADYTEYNNNIPIHEYKTLNSIKDRKIQSITRSGTTATLTTSYKHGFRIRPEEYGIKITGADQLEYCGNFLVIAINDYQLTFTVSNSAVTPATGTMYFDMSLMDRIHLTAQTDSYDNGYYVYLGEQPWKRIAMDDQLVKTSVIPYIFDGSENDNLEGSYPNKVDENGDQLTHFRKGYSNQEVNDFLKSKLNNSITFGKFSGSDRPKNEHGSMLRWLMDGRNINIGGQVTVDGFGLGSPETNGYPERTHGEVNPLNDTDVTTARSKVIHDKKLANWMISNNTTTSKSLNNSKSPILKDYPFIYNTESVSGNSSTGGHFASTVNENNLIFNIGSSSGATTNQYIRPFNYSALFYNVSNGYHNNITLDVTKNGIVNKHTISILHHLDTTDLTREFSLGFNTQDVSIANNTIHVDDSSYLLDGDAVVLTRIHSSDFTCTLPIVGSTSIQENKVFYVSGVNNTTDTFQLITANGGTIQDFASIGTWSGPSIEPDVLFVVSKISNQIPWHYVTKTETYTELNSVSALSLITDYSLIKKVADGTNYYRFYYSPRKKNTITALLAKGAGWTPSTLTYDDNGDGNSIRVYLESTETTYIVLKDYTLIKTTANLRTDILANNDMIPMLFLSTTPVSELIELFTYNTFDSNANTTEYETIHSKKTFVHLPTPIGLKDGTTTEIDISIPVVPNTEAFSLSTLGSVAGYKNFMTQPRAYVLSGYQKISCVQLYASIFLYAPSTKVMHIITRNSSGVATAHGIYSYSVTSYSAYPIENSIKVPTGKFSVGDHVMLYGTIPDGLTTVDTYVILSYTGEYVTLALLATPTVIVSFTESVTETTFGMVNQKDCYIYINSITNDYFNGDVFATVYSDTTFSVTLPSDVSEIFYDDLNYPLLNKITYVEGSDQIDGLTERSNDAIFGSNPEVSGATILSNVFHQTFNVSSIASSDKRVLLATLYPTSSNTFSWRIDKEPSLAMLQWNIQNIPNLGADTPAMVAYNRNKTIANTFDIRFDIESNPLTYKTTETPDSYNQAINSYLRVKLPSTKNGSLTSDEQSTVGSYEYQANLAHKSLIKDFLNGKVRVKSRKDGDASIGDDVVTIKTQADADVLIGGIDTLYSKLGYQIGYANNRGISTIPTSFYDEFMVTNNTEVTTNEDSWQRWLIKAMYNADYIVNAEIDTAFPLLDPYQGTSTGFKTYLSTYFSTNDAEREDSDASNRYIPGSLHSSIDPTYTFSTGTNHLFTDYLIKTGADSTIIDDVRRQLWDSSYTIPTGLYRQIQNAFQLTNSSPSTASITNFYGYNWIPFTKVFSTDVYAPTSIAVDSVISSSAETLIESLKSNPIASKYATDASYSNAFASLNYTDTDSELEEFIRSYIVGYATNMPTRFYNSYRTIVSGSATSTAYDTDITKNEITTEKDAERIFKYSVVQYLNDFGDDLTTSPLTAHYLDDNFILNEVSGSPVMIIEDYNPSWWYFESGNPVSQPTTSKIKTDIIASGMNYLADASFYRTKMKYSYIRYTMRFVFSKLYGRWMTLDYRQIPTSYLTPTIGNTALSYRSQSINSSDADGKEFLWTKPCGVDSESYIAHTPYFMQEPMTINKNCYSYLTTEASVYVNDVLNTEIKYDTDDANQWKYRMDALENPQTKINFIVPNDVNGGDLNNNLYLFQPNTWNVYYHMRPAISCMEGTDIPSPTSRTGGVMSDATLNLMFSDVNSRYPQFTIPWHENMNTVWGSN